MGSGYSVAKGRRIVLGANLLLLYIRIRLELDVRPGWWSMVVLAQPLMLLIIVVSKTKEGI